MNKRTTALTTEQYREIIMDLSRKVQSGNTQSLEVDEI